MQASEVPVLIVGAGLSGLATAACLSTLSIPSLIVDRDDCVASLWRNRTYDCLHLHLPKQACQLPHFPHPPSTPTFIPKNDFVQYLDDYAAKFDVRTLLHCEVQSARFDEEIGRWLVSARNRDTEVTEEYVVRYLVVASGENDVPRVPDIPGMDSFEGKMMHSSQYRSGSGFKGKDVLVVGSGNSGMEIAYDLCNHGANTSIVIRSPFHLVTKELMMFSVFLLKFLPLGVVNTILRFLCSLKFGDTSKYGICRPSKGLFNLKKNRPVYPVIDIGTFQKIKTGEIQVLPSLTSIKGNFATFSDGKVHHFDAIIFATGYRSMVKNWLKTDDYLIDDDGICKQNFPNHWKGKNGLYCTGLVGRGIYGSGADAANIAKDIKDDFKSSETDDLGN